MTLENEQNRVQKLQHDFTQMSDEDLLKAMAQDSHEAFDVFAERYLQPLNRLVYRMGFKDSDCEDMLQDVLVQVWNKAEMWRAQEGISARAWIYRVATNLCIDMHRKQKRQPVNEAVDAEVIPLKGTERSDAQAERSERREHIDKAMDGLPERSRMAINLVYYEEMSNKEAAETMGVSVKAIEGLLVRGRKMLKKALKRNEVSL